MHLSVLMLTVIFEIIIIGGVTLVLNRRSASRGDDFATASRSLPAIAIAATQALTCLGGGHIMGMPGAASGFGVAALWYQIASGIMIVLMMCVSGPWIRRLGFSNIPDMFSKMFDKRTGILISAFCCSSCFGVLTCELQGVGSVVSAITGSPIALGVLIGGVIGLLYVIFGGMEQVGWVNVFNAIFMYVGVFIAILYLNGVIDGGWVSVNEYYINNGEQWKLELFSNGETWRVYIIGTLVAGMFNQMVAGQSGQISASAKNVKTLRRAALYAVPMNTIFGAMMIALYMGTSVMPQYTSMGSGSICCGNALHGCCSAADSGYDLCPDHLLQLLEEGRYPQAADQVHPDRHSGCLPAGHRHGRNPARGFRCYDMALCMAAARLLDVHLRYLVEVLQGSCLLVSTDLRHLQLHLVLHQPARSGSSGGQQQLHRSSGGIHPGICCDCCTG